MGAKHSNTRNNDGVFLRNNYKKMKDGDYDGSGSSSSITTVDQEDKYYDARLMEKVADYIQQYDQRQSKFGELNKRRNEIDVSSIRKLMCSEEAMDDLLEIIHNHHDCHHLHNVPATSSSSSSSSLYQSSV